MFQDLALCRENESSSHSGTQLPYSMGVPRRKWGLHKGIAKEFHSLLVACLLASSKTMQIKGDLFWHSVTKEHSFSSNQVTFKGETSGLPFTPGKCIPLAQRERWTHAHHVIEGKLQRQKEQTHILGNLESRLCCWVTNETFYNHLSHCNI